MARLNFWSCFSAAKKSLPEIRQGELHTMGVFVQALASRGVATALSGALLSTRPVDQLVVSPQLCGSSLWMIPNPRGSLTYRFAVIITAWTDVCQPRRLKKFFAMASQRLPVLVHDTGEQHAVGGRGVCNGIGSGLDGAEDRLLCGAAGGDDGNLREVPADLRHDLRRGGGAGDIEKVGSRLQAAADVRVSGDHRDDHGNVHHLFDLADDIVGGGGIQHHAVGTLVLGLDGQPDGAGAGG